VTTDNSPDLLIIPQALEIEDARLVLPQPAHRRPRLGYPPALIALYAGYALALAGAIVWAAGR
jgi:hypothetical protein